MKKYSNTWESNLFLYDKWVKKDKINLNFILNKNIIYHYFRIMKAVYKGEFIVLTIYWEKEKARKPIISKLLLDLWKNNLNLKQAEEIIQIRVENNKIENIN